VSFEDSQRREKHADRKRNPEQQTSENICKLYGIKRHCCHSKVLLMFINYAIKFCWPFNCLVLTYNSTYYKSIWREWTRHIWPSSFCGFAAGSL